MTKRIKKLVKHTCGEGDNTKYIIEKYENESHRFWCYSIFTLIFLFLSYGFLFLNSVYISLFFFLMSLINFTQILTENYFKKEWHKVEEFDTLEEAKCYLTHGENYSYIKEEKVIN